MTQSNEPVIRRSVRRWPRPQAIRGLTTTVLLMVLLGGCRGEDLMVNPTDPSSGVAQSTAGSIRTIAITPDAPTVAVGSSAQLNAIALDRRGNPVQPQPAFTWTSGNKRVATVNSTGRVTARAIGTATIAARANGVTGRETVSVVAETPAVSQVTLAPAGATVVVGQTVQFSATARDASGNPVSPTGPITWGFTNPAVAKVDSTGLVTAVAPGSAWVWAIVDSVTGSQPVTVTSSPSAPTLTQVVISPAAATVQAGQTQQFSASGVLSNGNPTAVTVNYTATGGTVTSGGLYTAGGAAGSFRVVATEATSALADTATVTTAPSGFTTLWQLASFAGQNLNTVFQDWSGNDGTMAIVNGWLRQTIPSGASGGWADIHLNGTGGRPNEISTGTVRWSARVRLSANWGGKGRLLRIEGTRDNAYYDVAGVAGVCPAVGKPGAGPFFIARSSFAEFITGFPLRYYDQFVSQQGTVLGNCYGVTGEGGGFGTATFPGGNFLPTGGADFVLTEEVMLNTPGQQNGRHRIYINGVLRAEFPNLNFRNAGSNVVISVVGFEPYISSGGNPVGAPVYIEFSELLLQHDPTAVP